MRPSSRLLYSKSSRSADKSPASMRISTIMTTASTIYSRRILNGNSSIACLVPAQPWLPGSWWRWAQIENDLLTLTKWPPSPASLLSPIAVENTPGSIGDWPVPNFSDKPFTSSPIFPATNHLGQTPIMKCNGTGESPTMQPYGHWLSSGSELSIAAGNKGKHTTRPNISRPS